MIKKTLILTIVAVFSIKTALSQEQITLDYVNLVNAINDFSKSSVFVQTPQSLGTGVLFAVPFSDTSKLGSTYLATAKHILYKIDSIGKIVGRFDTINVILNLKRGSKEPKKYSQVLLAANLDIAVMQPIEFKRSFSEYDVTTPSLDMIASFSELRKGQLTFLSGFPYAIGTNEKTLNPVVQSGMIAFVDTLQSLVLVDIPVNHGNSGCPVYVVTDKPEIKLLGLIFEYEPSKQDFVYSSAAKQMVPLNTSLGRVVLIRSILSDLYKLPH